MHQSLQLGILARSLETAAQRGDSTAAAMQEAGDLKHLARLRVLKLRWMGLEDQADQLEDELAQDFATKLGARYAIAH